MHLTTLIFRNNGIFLTWDSWVNKKYDINIGYRDRIITRYLIELRMFQLNLYDINKLNIK